MAEVIAFTSGKGGMGKTVLCAAIGISLACSGHSVLCIDCNDVMGDLIAYLGVSQMQCLNYEEVCRGHYSLRQATHSHYNLQVLASPNQKSDITEAEMAALLQTARQEYDYILLDDPAFPLADRWVVVTQPNPAAIRGASRRADALDLQGATDIRLIVNAIDPKQMAALGLNVDDVMDRVGLPLLGIVPVDPGFTKACASSLLIYTGRRRTVQAVDRIASRIQGIQTAVPSRL